MSARAADLHRSPAPTWSAYAAASGDHNPIHQDEERRAQRRPARRHRARDVHDGAGRPRGRRPGSPGAEVVSFGCKFTQPVVVPAEGGVDVEVAGEVKSEADGLTTVALTVTCGGQKVLGHAEGRRVPCLSCSPTTPRCGSAARPRAGSRATTEAELVEAVARRRRGRRCWCSAAAATSSSPTRASAARVVEVATRGITPDVEDDAACGGVLVTVAAGEPWDDFVAHAPSSAAGSASRRSPASPARSAPPRSRTSAPTARRSRQTIASVRVWDRTLRGVRTFARRRLRLRLPHLALQGRPRTRATSSSTVTFQLRQGRPRRPGRLRRAGPHPRRRAGAAGAAGRRARRGARRCAPARAWCSTRPTTTPGAPARSSPTRSSRPTAVPEGAPAWPQPDGRVKTSAAWLIEHAGFAKGYGDRPGRPVDQAHAGAHQPRRRHHRRAARRWPARSATASRRASASGWSTSRCSSAASSRATQRRRPGVSSLRA